MRLDCLRLENFRSFTDLEVNFEVEKKTGGVTVILGGNARGKTNILEAIYLLALPKSFRKASPGELARFEQNYFLIKGDFDKVKLEYGFQIDPARRVYRCNENEVEIEEFLTNVQTVLFTPEDVELLNGSPAGRRKFLDGILVQTDKRYYAEMMYYMRILKQRNALLKRVRDQKAHKSELVYWTQEFVKSAEVIVAKRKKLFQMLQENLGAVYAEIANENCNDGVELEYKSSTGNDSGSLAEMIAKCEKYEILSGNTQYGPHRDDLVLSINKRKVADFCSRGEKRSFVLALKLLELQYMEKVTGSKPILLLDDVFSELDKDRREELLKLASKYQTIITTVEKEYFAQTEIDLQVIEI